MIALRANNKLILCLLLLLLAGCAEQTPVTHTRFLAFGTLVDLTIAGVSEQDAAQATEILEQ
ncbi:MAG: FAD:protein FMN transferase, partial [Chromatiales bacterium]|nr:FAD:protein FMN transferase [Chromatiales bacterium]